MSPVSEGDGYYKLAVQVDIDLAGQRNIAIERGAELPIHVEVVHHVLPAVAPAHVATTGTTKSAVCRHDEREAVLPRQKHLPARQVQDRAGVTRSSDIQVRRQERVGFHPRQHPLIAFQTDPHQHHRMMGIGNDFLDDLVTAQAIGIG